MIFISFFIIGIFITIGAFLSTGKGGWLIAGYNRLSKEEKEKFDEPALCKFMGKIMFTIAFVLLLQVISNLLGYKWFPGIFGFVVFVMAIYALIQVNTRKRFRK